MLQEEPFSAETFRYEREGEGFVIYSFGPDLEDNRGQALERGPDTHPLGDIAWRCVR